MSNSLPSSIKPSTATSVRILTYVFKAGSPEIEVLLNYLKNQNTLVKVFTDKNGYTTVTTTTTADDCEDDICVLD
jgi:hypothetical protein